MKKWLSYKKSNVNEIPSKFKEINMKQVTLTENSDNDEDPHTANFKEKTKTHCGY